MAKMKKRHKDKQ